MLTTPISKHHQVRSYYTAAYLPTRLMLSFLFLSLSSLTLLSPITSQAATASRTSAFEYDPISGLLIKEIIEPNSSELCLVTTYTYGGSGNKTSATTRNCNGSAGSHPGTNSEAAAPAAGTNAVIEPRTTSYVNAYPYHATGIGSTTNALNQSETKTVNSNFGTTASVTGPNNLTTTWTYDSFGRPLTETRADGTSTSTVYELCDGCRIVNTAVSKYTITTTQAGAPYSKTYYDMDGRAIETQTQDKDGAVIVTQVIYDNLGRTSKTSRPFKAGTTAVFSTVTYDKMNRPVTTTEPNGAVSSVAYNGYTTVATNAKGQTKTEVKNSQGQLVTVTDTQAKSLTYQYDPFGNLAKTTDALGNITTISYDVRGRKVGMDDPDQGVWSYQYDALGQLKRQIDAKNQNVTFAYDKLGRMTNRTEPDLISTWAYDTCDATLNPAGKCVGKLVKESADNASSRVMLYDAYGRPIGEQDAGTKISLVKNYDPQGRTSNLIYSYVNGTVSHSFQVTNAYSTTGHLSQVKNTATNLAYWTAGTTDIEGRVTNTTYGNGVTNTTVFNPLTGRISEVKAGPSDSVSKQTFVYDSIGNLTQRYDQVTSLNESFFYDSLNRLTSTSAESVANACNGGGGLCTQTTISYNEIGNILSKSDVGTYTYASLKANGSARPHAVSKITMNDGVTVYANYLYDANGNTTSTLDAASKGRTITWNSWNMPINITGNKPATANTTLLSTTPISTTTSSFQFVYNASHERVKETLPDGTIVLNMSPRVDTGIHIEVRTKLNGEITFMGSLYAGSMPFGAARTVIATTGVKTNSTSYFHGDHLGSIIAITNDAGAVTERRSYDAWGKRRNLNGTSMANAFVTSDVRHSFTGHEDLGEVGLIHMNGRLYDAATGRFLSADPTIQYADDMQNYNRYSYINNNPLSATDPSGYGFFSGLKKIFKKFGKAIKSILRNKILRLVATVAAAYYGGVFAGDLFASSAAFSGLSGTAYNVGLAIATGAGAGFAGGFVASGGNIKAALSGAVAGAVTGSVAGYYGADYNISRVFTNSVANGVSAKIQGRDFMEGLRSGLITSAFTYGNVLMRKAMIQNSLDPIAEGANDGRGFSNGMFGDLFKLAGGRFNPFAPVGASCSPLGCDQNGPGKIFGISYSKGGMTDMILESFAGPHDVANSNYYYDYNGNIKYLGNLSNIQSSALEYSTNYTSSLAFATPFAAAAISEQTNYSAFRYLKRRN